MRSPPTSRRTTGGRPTGARGSTQRSDAGPRNVLRPRPDPRSTARGKLSFDGDLFRHDRLGHTLDRQGTGEPVVLLVDRLDTGRGERDVGEVRRVEEVVGAQVLVAL